MRSDQPAIDYAKLGAMLRRKRLRHGGTCRSVPGMSASIVSRFGDKEIEQKFAQARIFLSACRYLRLPPEAFFVANRGKVVHYADASTIERIQATLWADQTLTEQARDALLDLMEAAVALEDK